MQERVNCAVSSKEIAEHGPYIRSALPQYERKVDAMGHWSQNFVNWKMDCSLVDDEYDHYCASMGRASPGIGVSENTI